MTTSNNPTRMHVNCAGGECGRGESARPERAVEQWMAACGAAAGLCVPLPDRGNQLGGPRAVERAVRVQDVSAGLPRRAVVD